MIGISPTIRGFSDCRGGVEGHGRRKFSDERKFSDMFEVSRTCAQFLGTGRNSSDMCGFFSVMNGISPTIRSFSDCRGEIEGHGRRKFSDERKFSNMFEVSRTCAQFLGRDGRSFSDLCEISRTTMCGKSKIIIFISHFFSKRNEIYTTT